MLSNLVFSAALLAVLAQQPTHQSAQQPAAQAVPPTSAKAAPAHLSPELETKKQKAGQLLANAQFLNALPLYEELAKAVPEDGEIEYGLAACLFGKATNDAAPEEVKPLLDRSRQAAVKAKQLGYQSDQFNLLQMALSSGSTPRAQSTNPEANQKLKEGEAAFGRGDNDGAIAGYAAALKLDPKLYYAALFAGDACYRKHDLTGASEWFSKAVSISPNIETAHRYWGDALSEAGKSKDARDHYIDAIVADPYTKLPWTSLVSWSKKNNVKLEAIQLNRPATSIGTAKAADDHTSGKGEAAWTIYSRVRASWRTETFAKRYPKEKQYRHTLEEENEALTAAAKSVEEKGAANLDPQLANLEKLKKDGMIPCWILLSGADEGIAQDYPAYRDAHRDLLRRYLGTFIIREQAAN